MIRLSVVAFALLFASSVFGQDLLEQRLNEIPLAELAKMVKEKGDPQRGALTFYQQNLNCAKCHEAQGDLKSLAPNLESKREAALSHLITSLLNPSETIFEGYETVVIQTEDGETVSGVLSETTESELRIARIENPSEIEVYSLEEIEWKRSSKSTMPEGLANQLADEQQFFDLISYLDLIARDGPSRAAQLRPATAFISLPPLPQYESRVNHRGLIERLDDESFARGEKIFTLHCASCHGTADEEGSMPTSLRFVSGKFKHGGDPHTMYQTLTEGYGMMNAQRWMVPQQKYDVIHYIREAFVRDHNSSQYVEVTRDYLAGLPQGDTFGPPPASSEPWVQMDYGASLMNTIEVSRDGSNIAQKGIVFRLDDGPGGVESGQHWMMYEHDTMRVAAAWSGEFIDWNGIHFNGRHAVHPRVTGQVHFANPTAPGWGRPADGSFEDNRVIGRDGKKYGPLDREWLHYRGMYRYGSRSVISYAVGNAEVLESPSLIYVDDSNVFARQLNIGPRDKDLIVRVASIAELRKKGVEPVVDSNFVRLVKAKAEAESKSELIASEVYELDGSTYAQFVDGSNFDMTNEDFTITARIKTTANGTIFCKTKNWAEWVPDGKTFFVRGGQLCYDIGWVGVAVSERKVNDGQWHDVALTWSAVDGLATFFVDGENAGGGEIAPNENVDDHSIRIGYTNEDFPNPSYFEGALTNVRFFQRALKEEELQPSVNPKNAIVDWHRVNGQKLVDRSENGFDAEVIAGESRSKLPEPRGMMYAVSESAIGATWIADEFLCLKIPAGEEPMNFTIFHCPVLADGDADAIAGQIPTKSSTLDLSALTKGGPSNYSEIIETEIQRGEDNGPFAVDVLNEPRENPWNCRVRLTGIDFFNDSSEAICTAWDGSVWHVRGIDQEEGKLTWQRIAVGLFQPLGVKIRDGEIFVTCRDQLVRLHDLNGDGEMDWYENFNSDHQVTEHFHEFAMGLQTDDVGNFYYAKSARHALKAIVPHHGTLLKVSRDGSTTEILANGFRAANGVCLNPDGTFYVTDQEGHWNPKNRINWVKEGGFYGNMFGYHDVEDSSDEAMDPPMCWITNSFDRSPSELMWVESEKWGPLNGSLLNFSYGYGQVYVVPHETLEGQVQGGMCAFPIARFPTGVMRGRFHPADGQLYCCGMFAWAGDQHRPGGLYRIRYTGKPVHLPVGLNATDTGMRIRFSDRVDEASATNVENYKIRTWTIKRTARYGSQHFDEKELAVENAQLLSDGRTVVLSIPKIHKTRCMEIVYSLKTFEGKKLEGRIHNTIHHLGKSIKP